MTDESVVYTQACSSLKLCASMVNIESASNAIWWIKNPKAAAAGSKGAKPDGAGGARKKSLGLSFCLDMADLLRNISLQGYNKLLAPELTLAERLIWLLVHATTFSMVVAVLSVTWEQFVAQYFVTNLKDPLYPVQNVPFPAVSICSSNRISKQAVTKYAQQLQKADPEARDLNYYLDHLLNLIDLYNARDSSFETESYAEFQALLDAYGTWDNETFFNTRRIMKMLTPTCESLILRCSLANKEISCFSKTAFQESLTFYGPCCTFNDANTLKFRNFSNRLANSELGLTIVVNASRSDYFAPILNTNGYIVVVHSADNYASIYSSNAMDMFPGQRDESFLELDARVVDTDEALRSFSPIVRRCYFQDEAPNSNELLRATYTFPNCISRCRVNSVLALCRCLPFYMPLELLNNKDGLVYCTLSHVECMQRYLFKWRNVLTERQSIPGLERELQEGLYCPQCLPSCNDVLYSVSMQSLPIDNYLMTLSADNDTQLGTDIAVLRVYFGEPHAQYYIRLLNNAWYEVFSTVGNILSIIMGFCMVAIFEVLFVLIKYIYGGCTRLFTQNSLTNLTKKELAEKQLYICP